MNSEIKEIDSAILFGESCTTALATIVESDKSPKKRDRFDRIYNHIHFIPMDQNGIMLLKMMTVPNWKEKILARAFSSDIRLKGYGNFEYDAHSEGTYFISFFDGDIARLIRFYEGISLYKVKAAVICYPWQVDFLREYLKGRAGLKAVKMDAISQALGIN